MIRFNLDNKIVEIVIQVSTKQRLENTWYLFGNVLPHLENFWNFRKLFYNQSSVVYNSI